MNPVAGPVSQIVDNKTGVGSMASGVMIDGAIRQSAFALLTDDANLSGSAGHGGPIDAARLPSLLARNPNDRIKVNYIQYVAKCSMASFPRALAEKKIRYQPEMSLQNPKQNTFLKLQKQNTQPITQSHLAQAANIAHSRTCRRKSLPPEWIDYSICCN